MMNKTFSKDQWTEALTALMEKYTIYVPVKEGDFYLFRDLSGLKKGKRPDFSYQNARLSPKGVVYPQSERMFDYSLDKDDVDAFIMKETAKDFSPQAVVGVRPCDAHGFEIVRRNFDNPEFRDPWWVKRRESTTLVGLACSDPCSACFCTSVGGSPHGEIGLDVLMVDLGDQFLVRSTTDKGEAFLSLAEGGEEAEESAVKQARKMGEDAISQVTSCVSTDKLKDKVVTELFDAPFWDDVAFSCINCGTCTYLCPTCWCFDVQDETYGKKGDRIRNWDSCMFPLFTLHGSGHNPRDTKTQRVRQRFMHKLNYYVSKYNNGVQCSGCGRCVRFCPVNIDIRQVCEMMNSY
jgi:ferredoxin